MNDLSETKQRIVQLADRCVMCGLCSTQCPTYQLQNNENESPRGRISIMKALARGELTNSPETEHHLQNCLQCRNCEKLCPSKVSYGEMLDLSKSTLIPPQPHSQLGRSLKPRSKTLSLLRALQTSGAFKLARAINLDGLLKKRRELTLLPRIPKQKQWSSFYPAHIESQGQVALFTGCATDSLDNPTLDAGIRLLNRYGFSVFVPPEQNCCGALDLHSGELKRATELAENNIRTFNGLKIRAILYTATGCGGSLLEYGKLPLRNIRPDQMARFNGKPKELTSFILDTHKDKPLPYKRLQKTVAIFTPCSARNVIKDSKSVADMLDFIPGLQVTNLPDQPACCGAAGTHMLTHAEQADALGTQILQHVINSKADLIVSHNIGCTLHLQALIREKGLDIPVIHPIALLNQQLA